MSSTFSNQLRGDWVRARGSCNSWDQWWISQEGKEKKEEQEKNKKEEKKIKRMKEEKKRTGKWRRRILLLPLLLDHLLFILPIESSSVFGLSPSMRRRSKKKKNYLEIPGINLCSVVSPCYYCERIFGGGGGWLVNRCQTNLQQQLTKRNAILRDKSALVIALKTS